MLLDREHALGRIDDLLEADGPVADEGQRGIGIVILVQLAGPLLRQIAVGVDRRDDAAREVAPIRYEIDLARERGHQTADALAYLVQMLVRERLVHGQIVDPLAEMRGRSEFLPRSGRTGQGRHMHVRTEQPGRSQRQHAQLQAGRETTRIGDIARRAYPLAVHLGQAVNEPTAADGRRGRQAEILTQIDHAHRIGKRRRL